MSDHEVANSTEARGEELPLIPPPPSRISRRDLRTVGGGVGLGLVIGVLGTLLITSLASGAGRASSAIGISPSPSIAKSTAIADAVKVCNVSWSSWITVGDAGQSISMKSDGKESPGADIADLACVLRELHTPDSVISRIDSTRALDGRQTATWKTYSASWGYHPDNGLDIVIEVVEK